jgi:WD40 repeat protein
MAGIAEPTIPVPPPENLDGSGAAGHAIVDPQNPWPGPDAYDEASRDFFKGRGAEAAELLRLIRVAPLTVLYSKSGLGKTSLLQAGLFPLLRREHYLPVPLRLDFAQATVTPPLEQVMQRLTASLTAARADFPPPESGEGIWEFLHRRDAEFWSPDNFPLVPVLIFDQFEELFSRTGGNAQLIRKVFNDLADLIENRIPAEVASETAGARRSRLDLLTQHYRVLLSFREDYLPDVRTWEKQVPSLLRNTLRLDPMSRDCAIRAVQETGKAVLEDDVAPYIVDFVGRREQAGSTADTSEAVIEPVLLSLCCTQLNLRRAKGARIDIELVKNAGQDILESFYRGALEDPEVKGEPDVAYFIETYLIQGDHFRGDYPKREALDEHKLREPQLSALTDRIRLVRIVYRSDTARIELIHDRLVPVVRKARDQRQALEAQAERDKERAYNAELVRQRDKANRNLKWAAALALLSLVLAAFAVLKGVQFRQLKTHATVGWSVERLAGGRLALDAMDPLDEMGYRALAAYRLSQREKNLREAMPASLSALNTVLGKYVHLSRIVRVPDLTPTPALEYSPDGKTLAIGGEDGVVRLLDLATAKVTRTLDCQPRGTGEAAWDLAFNSSGSRLAVGYSSDVANQPASGMVCVFDLEHASNVRWASHEHGGAAADVYSVAYGGQGGDEYVISGGSDSVLRKWDLVTHKVLEMPQTAKVVAVAINSNGQRVASGGDDGLLKVWNVGDLGDMTKHPQVLTGHQSTIQQIAFSPVNPDRLISAGDDGRIMAWNVDGGCLTDESKRQDARIETVAINADGLFLASGGADGYVRMFKLPSVIAPCAAQTHRAGAATPRESPEFDVISEGLLSGHGGTIWGVAFGPDGDQLASAGQDGSVRIWVRNSGSFSLAGLETNADNAIKDVRIGADIVQGKVTATAVTPDSKSIVAGDETGNLYVWNRPPEMGAPAMLGPNVAWKAHDGPIRGLICLRIGDRMAVISAGGDNVIRRWDMSTHEMIGSELALKSLWAIALSPDGRVLAAGTPQGMVQLWDPTTGENRGQLPPSKATGTDFALSSIGFTSDGKYLVMGSNYAKLLIRDPAHPDWQRWLQGQNMGTTAVAHGKSAWLLSSGVDGSLLEWDAAALQRPESTGLRVQNDFKYRMGTPGFRMPDSIASMAVSSDGKIILTGGKKGQVQLWDGVGHVLISDHFEGHGDKSIESVALAPDASFFVTADDAKILVWPGPERWADILCSKLPWNMSHQRWKEWVSPDVPYLKQCPDLPVWPDPVNKAAK